MKLNFLSQGLSQDIENTVGIALIKYLSSSDYYSFTGISAFASEAGINGLSEYIERAKETFQSQNIIIGVDQKGTSKEALEAIMNLGINTRIFYQPGFTIFHPKIYFFEGDQVSQLIIGSSNLTRQGLFQNVEASVHLELNSQDAIDRQILDDLKARFIGLFDFTDANLQKITAELIEQLVAEKIVPTEAERKEIQERIQELESLHGEPVEKIIRTIFPRRQQPVVPKGFRKKTKGKVAADAGGEGSPATEIAVPKPSSEDEFELVWRRRRLPASSVEIVRTENTNPTGGLRLVQDKFEVAGVTIDHTTHFRNSVFGDLSWATEKMVPLVEKAIGKFYISILDNDLGLHALEIRHKPSGEAGQRNYTTSISWGALSVIIRDRVLTGRMLNLYRSEAEEGTFKLEIV